MYKKKLEDMNVMDDFLFMEMVNYGEKGKEFCKILLETIFDRPLRDISIVAQKVMTTGNHDQHAIRVDAFISEQEEKAYAKISKDIVPISNLPLEVFDIEMEKADKKEKIESLPERSRYYHAMIDRDLLKAGDSYTSLKKAFVIFIMEKDPFGENLMWYTVKNQILERPQLPYEDGNVTIYLYTEGKDNKGKQALTELLHYIADSKAQNVTNDKIAKIHTIASEIKEDEEVKKGYMKSWEYEQLIREEERENGLLTGKEIGKEIGKEKKLIEFVCKKIQKSKSIEAVAEELEEEVSIIKRIYEVAWETAPEYDVDQIYDILHENI